MDSLTPSDDRWMVDRRLKETSEFCEINKYESGAGLERFPDIIELLERIDTPGTFLDGKEILRVADLASVSSKVYRNLSSKRDKYPAVWRIASELTDFREMISNINRIITPEGIVADNASKALMKIRQEMDRVRSKITDKLNKLITSKSSEDFIADRIVTMRDGRYVIPVKDSHKSSVSGVVHDRSSSGATVFMEPLEMLPMNNRLRELHSEEKREIERILIGLCDSIRDETESLLSSQEALARLDFIHARALLSEQYDGVTPELTEESVIKLRGARHPLLFIDGALPKDKVIPLDFSLGESGRVIIITGPNTGGKTVALKTVGMAVMLAQSGLQVPARYARLGIFETIFADIGDEQSIAMSLSTFSGHMKQICYAIDNCDEKSLVLFDELGSGTDPVEGAALGEAVIEYIVKSGSLAIFTTHLGALKTLAGDVPEIRNASMEFDRENLMPTYKFQPDIPGASYAIEVTEKLGMRKSVLKRAKQLVDTGHRDLASLVAQLEANLAKVKKERDELIQSRRAASDLEELYQTKLQKMKEWEKESDRLALEKAESAVADAQKEVEDLIASINKTKADRETARNARRKLQEKQQSLKQKAEKLAPKQRPGLKTAKPGDRVYVRSMHAEGEVLTAPDDRGQLQVRVGNLKVDVRLRDLEKMDAPKPQVKSAGVKYERVQSFNPELDLRGMTFEEAEPRLDRYLEDAVQAGVGIVRIIHGKGTGMLRKKVQIYLRQHRHAAEMRLGEYHEGGMGVTVVKVRG